MVEKPDSPKANLDNGQLYDQCPRCNGAMLPASPDVCPACQMERAQKWAVNVDVQRKVMKSCFRNHCQTCRHWMRRQHPFQGHCLLSHGKYCDADYNRADAFICDHGEGSYAVTGPGFGCVRWEAKP